MDNRRRKGGLESYSKSKTNGGNRSALFEPIAKISQTITSRKGGSNPLIGGHHRDAAEFGDDRQKNLMVKSEEMICGGGEPGSCTTLKGRKEDIDAWKRGVASLYGKSVWEVEKRTEDVGEGAKRPVRTSEGRSRKGRRVRVEGAPSILTGGLDYGDRDWPQRHHAQTENDEAEMSSFPDRRLQLG